MQSSSTAKLAGIAVLVAVVLAYQPAFLTPDALAQTVTFPSPVLGSTISGTLAANVSTSSVRIVQPKELGAVSVATSSVKVTYPRLVVPSINLNDPIVDVGLDSTGAMAVPNGKTNEVGLYDGGPQPGDVGSAVLDAHVFAAFSKLNDLTAGDDIYIEMSATKTLHFVVTKTETFALADITSQDLFVPTSDRDLNLITCAGKLTPDHSTYDHRLVVYTTLVK